MNAQFFGTQFESPIKVFGKILASFVNSALSDKHDHGHIFCTKTNMDIFFKI